MQVTTVSCVFSCPPKSQKRAGASRADTVPLPCRESNAASVTSAGKLWAARRSPGSTPWPSWRTASRASGGARMTLLLRFLAGGGGAADTGGSGFLTVPKIPNQCAMLPVSRGDRGAFSGDACDLSWRTGFRLGCSWVWQRESTASGFPRFLLRRGGLPAAAFVQAMSLAEALARSSPPSGGPEAGGLMSTCKGTAVR